MIEHLLKSVATASSNTKINDICVEGLTNFLVKAFLNNLVSMQNASYLELGPWQGATFISALYKNSPKQAIAIDNFSEFNNGEIENKLHDNCKKYLKENDYEIYNCNCFAFDKSKIKIPVNIFFYDCDHKEYAHKYALKYFYEVLADEFIYSR
jgi:endoglucanase Acf2